MAKKLGFAFLLLAVASICEATAIFTPISEAHRSAALELFSPAAESFSSLEEASEALRIFEVLGIEIKPDLKDSSCKSVVDTLSSGSPNSKDMYHALRVSSVLKCKISEGALMGVASRLKDSIKDEKSLLDFYFSIGGLVLIKDQAPEVDVLLEDANGIFRTVKDLSQSDGKWRYSSNNPESSTYAAGVAFETLSGIFTLKSSDIDGNLIEALKKDVVKQFDNIEKYDMDHYGKEVLGRRRSTTPVEPRAGGSSGPSRRPDQLSPDASGYLVSPSAYRKQKSPSPVTRIMQFVRGSKVRHTAAKTVAPGNHVRHPAGQLGIPPPVPVIALDDDDEPEEDDVDGPLAEADDPPVLTPAYTPDGYGDDNAEDEAPDESVPMVIEPEPEVTHAWDFVGQTAHLAYPSLAQDPRDPYYAERLRAMYAANPVPDPYRAPYMQRSYSHSAYPYPPMMDPVYPPPHYPYQPYPPHFEPPRSSYAGPSQPLPYLQHSGRSVHSGSSMGSPDIAALVTRTESLEREHAKSKARERVIISGLKKASSLFNDMVHDGKKNRKK